MAEGERQRTKDTKLKTEILKWSSTLFTIVVLYQVAHYVMYHPDLMAFGQVKTTPDYVIPNIKIGQTVDLTDYQYSSTMGAYSFAIKNKNGGVRWIDSYDKSIIDNETAGGYVPPQLFADRVFVKQSSLYPHLALKRIGNVSHQQGFMMPSYVEAQYVLEIPSTWKR